MRRFLLRTWARLRGSRRKVRNGKDKAPQSVRITPLLKTWVTASGQPIAFPQSRPQVVASIYEIPPGMALAEHQHPFLRYGYILAGRLRVANSETGQTDIYGPGDFGIEAIGQWHRGETIGAETVKILVIDQVEEDAENVVLRV
jgi:quercetin dioxygenase-like cupin family protein